MRRSLLGVIVLVGLVTVPGSTSSAAAPCSVPTAIYPTIQDAVDDGTCDPILIAAGTYAGFSIIRAVTIQGAGAALTEIDGSGGNVISANAGSDLLLRDVTLTGGGQAIRNDQGDVTIEDSIIRENDSGQHGGASFLFSGASLIVRRSLIVGNSAETGAGGAFHLFDAASTLVVTDSSITGSSAPAGGGAIENGGSATLTNTTISGNHTHGDGGGIEVLSTGTLDLNNVTVTDNTADDLAGSGGDGGGLFVGTGVANLRNTILSGNHDASPGAEAPDCSGTPTSLGHNLIGNTAGCTYVPGTGDKVGIDAQLAPLGDFGGPTLTHSPTPTSPAIDGVAAGSCTDGSATVTADQRGVPRPIDGDGNGAALCDIGAVEWAPRNLELDARNKVKKGKKVQLNAVVTPCIGHEGDVVHFMKKAREIAAIPLDADCAVSARSRVTRKTSYTATLDAEPEHPADSDKERVKIRKPR